ncbi:FliH/SctL family protein [Novosphingobium sp.]|uniref:FliH/SctL family protein n=1 Tax=Novosphingobium sp. TaxID=1874826 RepID=UPI002B48E332|nr:FliH/SctL family protein [Novosphingobium sp.]HKR90772.1 FliH/SctL family protein [Novosphingobium sp.]HKT76394.1 FliH/SctL family protein [Sphingobium sp.]
MSDLSFPLPRSGFNQLEVFARPVRFMPDARFAGLPDEPAPQPLPPIAEEVALEDMPDPVADAYNNGFVAGYEQAMAEAKAHAAADDDARQGLALSIARLDSALEEELRLRLRDTVAALCEAAIAPVALDQDALVRRVQRAAAMLARADDERVIRLHPKDVELVSPRLPEEWHVEPDARLERGTIRIESANGGVEDGPATWRLAIAEALHQC